MRKDWEEKRHSPWTTKNHKTIITIMSLIIMLFLGIYIKDMAIGSRVQANEESIRVNATEINREKAVNRERHLRIEKQLRISDEKLDTISTAITQIQTILEVR